MQNNVRVIEEKVLSNNWYLLKTTTFDLLRRDGTWQRQQRETYDRGNGATILLYNRAKQTIILTRQFRFPTFVNGSPDGMLVEACAGLLDQDDPVTCIRREAEEETGYQIKDVRKVFEAYMSPVSQFPNSTAPSGNTCPNFGWYISHSIGHIAPKLTMRS